MMDIHGLLNKNLHLSTKEGPQFMFSLCFVSCTRLKILKVHVIHLTKGAGYRLIGGQVLDCTNMSNLYYVRSGTTSGA
jgi:hypothetical protein